MPWSNRLHVVTSYHNRTLPRICEAASPERIELYGSKDMSLVDWLFDVAKKRCSHPDCTSDSTNHVRVLLHGGSRV